MEVTTQPVYIKDTEVNNITGNVLLEICFAINQQFPGEIYGAQKINNVWSIYVSNNRIRAALIVSGITVQGNRLDVHDDNPLRGESNKSERITIKDLPATLSPTNIMSFLRGFRQLNIKSKVIYAKERMGGDQMSPFINGDRLIYVHPNVSPPLPKETVISGHPCRIWHASQKNYCKRCATHGHRTMDIEECQSYNADCAVSAFRSNNNPLSNFYPCSIIHDGKTFISAEHFYQYQMCMYCNHQDAAEKVHAAPNAKAAKDIASDLKAKLTAPILAGWIKTRVSVMEETLKLKWNCCGKFRQALMATMGTTIAEATQDTFWGVGVAPNLAEETDPNHFLGFNQLGRILMSMRRYVAERELYKNNQEYELITAEDPSVASSQSPTGEVSNLIPSDESESSSKSSVVHDVSSSHTSENADLTSAGNSDRLPVHTCANNPTIMTGDTTDLSAKSHPGTETGSSNDVPSSSEQSMDMDDDVINTPPQQEQTDEHSSKNTDTLSLSSSSLPTSKESASKKPARINYKKLIPAAATERRKITNSTKPSGTLDNFVIKQAESPYTKRKHSSGAVSLSPSSVQLTKTVRTDGADEVS